MEIRRLTAHEALPQYTALHNAVHPDDPVTAGDLAGWVEAIPESAFFLALDGEDAVGVGWVALNGTHPTPEVRLLVLADRRRRGIGSALFSEVSAWAAGRGHLEVEARVWETHPEAIEYAVNRGFSEIGRERGLELDLTAIEAPTPELPDGVEIVTWAERPELAAQIYEIYCESVPDVPGEEGFRAEPFETWLVNDMGGPGDRPEATFVAVADGVAVGYAKFALSEALPSTAYHDLTGVRRAWRGRGIAGALKATQIRWAKEHGYERLVTQNEERNTPIRRLNERFGYRPAPGRVLLRGPVEQA